MSKAKLKKLFMTLTKEEIIEVIMELYDARKEAKDYLEFYLNPDEDAKLEEYKKIICNEFFPKRGDAKLRFSVCRKAISDFKKLKPHPSCLADLMLYQIELACELTMMYGDMWEQYYSTVERNFITTMVFISKSGYTKQFSARIERMFTYIKNCGWWFPDNMRAIYEKHK